MEAVFLLHILLAVQMGIASYKAPESKQFFIVEYWHLTAARDLPVPPITVLPDGFIEVIFNGGDPYKVQVNEKEFTIDKGVHLRGITLHPIKLLLPKNINIWGVRLNPVWIKPLLEHHLSSSFEQVVTIPEMALPANSSDLSPEAFIQHFLEGIQWGNANEVDSVVKRAMALMEKEKGELRIEQLAKDSFVSTSKLERSFKKELGLTPKAYCQLLRFRNIALEMAQNKGLQQNDVVGDHNLTDQSHLNKISRTYANETPEELKTKISRFFTKTYFDG